MADGRDYGYFWNDDGSGDRTYNADSFEYWLKKFFTTGVFAGDLQVTAGGSYTVKVATGYANVNGKVKDFYNTETFTVPSANSTYPRIDTIVVRRDDTNKIISLQYVTGTYSGRDPVPTAPTRSGAIYELVLAEIYVGAGATEILQKDITDKRADKTVCGIVTGTVEEVDFSQFASQFNSYYNEFKSGKRADFETWFENIKGKLSGDIAGSLQNQIDIAREQLANIGNTIYPVGAIYLSTTDTSPASLFGGTWERLKDRFLLAAGDSYAAGSTGGEAQHTLTVDEMPSHGHEIDQLWTDSPGNNQLANGGAGFSLRYNHNKTTSLTGGGEPHNNMPPYLAVYMWKRIA